MAALVLGACYDSDARAVAGTEAIAQGGKESRSKMAMRECRPEFRPVAGACGRGKTHAKSGSEAAEAMAAYGDCSSFYPVGCVLSSPGPKGSSGSKNNRSLAANGSVCAMGQLEKFRQRAETLAKGSQ
jgi:hypothetical protein